MLQVPIREIIGNENFPCEARLITSFLFPPLWAGPLLLGKYIIKKKGGGGIVL